MMKDQENFRMYYLLQYDRIDKLETRRDTFCNYVITISSGLYILGFTNADKLNFCNSALLVTLVCLVNVTAILFICRTRPLIKMHQKRAKEACSLYANKLNKISSTIEKRDSDKDFFRRSRLYSYLHGLIIILSILSIALKTNVEQNSNSVQKIMIVKEPR